MALSAASLLTEWHLTRAQTNRHRQTISLTVISRTQTNKYISIKNLMPSHLERNFLNSSKKCDDSYQEHILLKSGTIIIMLALQISLCWIFPHDCYLENWKISISRLRFPKKYGKLMQISFLSLSAAKTVQLLQSKIVDGHHFERWKIAISCQRFSKTDDIYYPLNRTLLNARKFAQ